MDALQARIEVAVKRQTLHAAGYMDATKLWYKSSTNVKVCKLLGSLMPSKLWLKSQPNVKLRRLLSRCAIQVLVEILANVKVCKLLGQFDALQALVEVSPTSNSAGCLSRWMPSKRQSLQATGQFGALTQHDRDPNDDSVHVLGQYHPRLCLFSSLWSFLGRAIALVDIAQDTLLPFTIRRWCFGMRWTSHTIRKTKKTLRTLKGYMINRLRTCP